MKKTDRIKVWLKYDKHCAYCGKILEYKQLQVDHIQALWRNDVPNGSTIVKGKDDITNWNPSCARCNKWKSTWSIEEFRTEIEKQQERVKRDSSGYRILLDYGLITEHKPKVVFYFETL